MLRVALNPSTRFASLTSRHTVSPEPAWMVIHGTMGRKHNLFRFGRKRWYKPAKKNSRGESAQKLCHHEAWCIDWTNPGKCICECSRKRYCWIGKGCGSREPEETRFLRLLRRCGAKDSLPFQEQQLGAQHDDAAAGLLARIKALMNLPSTSRARASISRP